VMAALHAMHLSLALLFLIWVTLNALADRYDPEYSWGVTVCTSFWNGLGIAWMCILMAFVIATSDVAGQAGREEAKPGESGPATAPGKTSRKALKPGQIDVEKSRVYVYV